MAASEHTPSMGLSQFGPDDRPSWIDDYNTDMRIIEQIMGEAFTQGASQAGPLFCTAHVRYGGNFTVSTKTPYRADFFAHYGNMAVDYNTHTIPITKSGYYAVSGSAAVSGVTPDTGDDKSLILDICKYYKNGDYEGIISSGFNKSYETREIPDSGTPQSQSCSITPVIVELLAGDVVTMEIVPAEGVTTTLHGQISAMYLTLESKTFDNAS